MKMEWEKPPPGQFTLGRALGGGATAALLAVVCFLVISCFFRPTLTQGHSMKPTLRDGDLAIATIFRYAPTRGDVVIIHNSNSKNNNLVKRIIGLPGDQIDIDFTTGAVSRNGLVLDEPYLTEPTLTPGDVEFPLTVPNGQAFVMGDNRNHSTDSRTSYTGMIPLENIKGKISFQIYPFNKMGKVE